MTMTASVRRPAAGKFLLGPVACVALLAGCMGSDPVEEQWASRESLPSCGSLRLQQGEQLKVDGRTEVACLGRAIESGRGAELTVRYPTTEGDPITDYYRVTPDGSTEVYTDSTGDAFSDRKWSFAACEQPRTALDVNC
jgi:hypothetical protein